VSPGNFHFPIKYKMCSTFLGGEWERISPCAISGYMYTYVIRAYAFFTEYESSRMFQTNVLSLGERSYESSRTFAKVPKTILLWTPRACGARVDLKWMCVWGGPTGHPTHTSTSENDDMGHPECFEPRFEKRGCRDATLPALSFFEWLFQKCGMTHVVIFLSEGVDGLAHPHLHSKEVRAPQARGVRA
jgi:hypothetical protein